MPLLDKYELFIFDWDHTLTTSTLVVSLLEFLGRTKKKMAGSESSKSYDEKLSVRDIRVKEKVNRLYSFLDDAYSIVFRPQLKKDTLPLLALLRKKRKKIAIFSDSKAYRLLKETRELGVLKYVDFTLSAESIDYFKPNPAGLLMIMDKLSIPKKKCIYIGDMGFDVLTARLAGIDSCLISSGIDSAESLRRSRPRYSFQNLAGFAREFK